MAVAFRAVSAGTGTDATGEGTIPTGTTTGDLMVAFISHSSSGATISTPPTGWTLQEADPNPADFSLWCYTRPWQSGDSNPTWTFSAAGNWTVDIVSYSGVDSTTPVNVDTGEIVAAANAIALGAITPTVNNCMLLAYASIDATGAARTWTEDGSMTERLEQTDNALHRVIAEELLSGGSGVGQTRTLTADGNTQDIGGFLLAIAPTAGQSAALGTVTETDTAQSLGKSKRAALGIIVETDAAQPLGRRKAAVTGITAEADTAQALGRRKVRAIGTALETDTAVAIAVGGDTVVAVGIALETEFVQPFGRRKQQAFAVAAETDTTLSFGRVKRKALGVALEVDTALLVGEAEPIFPAVETDAAQPVGRRKVRALGTAFETDTALEITRFIVTKIVKFPTYKERLGEPRLLSRYTKPEPVSLIKKAGVWTEVVSPHQDEISAAEGFWQGGHRHVLTEAQAADLPPQYVEEI